MRVCLTPLNTSDWEPIELQLLKKDLANLECKCSACETAKEEPLSKPGNQVDAGIQAERYNGTFDRFTYDYSQPTLAHKMHEGRSGMMDYFRHDNHCPNCYFIWDLLRGLKTVLKDEESETKPETSDKCTEKDVEFVDSTTSVTNKPVRLPSNLNLCDYILDSCSNSTVHSQLRMKARDRVAFYDPFHDHSTCVRKEPKTLHGNCFCLEKLIDSIRPPINSFN